MRQQQSGIFRTIFNVFFPLLYDLFFSHFVIVYHFVDPIGFAIYSIALVLATHKGVRVEIQRAVSEGKQCEKYMATAAVLSITVVFLIFPTVVPATATALNAWGPSHLNASVERSESLRPPSYFQNYAPVFVCWWIITAHPGCRVRIIVISYKPEKDIDSLQVYDASSPEEATKPSKTLSAANDSFLSDSNHVTVKFASNKSDAAKGFEVTYKAIENPPDVPLFAIISIVFMLLFSVLATVTYFKRQQQGLTKTSKKQIDDEQSVNTGQTAVWCEYENLNPPLV